MIEYIVYHIPAANKIGVTKNMDRRPNVMGKDDARYDNKIEILETIIKDRDDADTWEYVGDREAFWREQYGCNKDSNHYAMSRDKLRIAAGCITNEDRSRGGMSRAALANNPFRLSETGIKGVRAQFASGTHINQRGISGFQQKIVCPHCRRIGRLASMKRWHFDNCKRKGG